MWFGRLLAVKTLDFENGIREGKGKTRLRIGQIF